MKQLNQDMKTGQFKPVYLLYGEEEFLKKSYKNKLKDAVAGGDSMNCTIYEGKDVTPEEVIAMADTLPFFSERRFILVEDSGWFKKDSKNMADYLPDMPETTVLVFVEKELDKRNRLYKQVIKLGYAAEMKKQNQSQLSRWVLGLLDREGIRITEPVMDSFLNRAGEDMNRIHSELDKLISYLGERKVVTEEDLEAICTSQITGKIFDMITALAQKNRKKALGFYYDLLALKEPPMRSLFLIARQYNQLLEIKELFYESSDSGAIAKKMGLPPFAVGKLRSLAKAFSIDELKHNVEACVSAEEDIKTGRLQDMVAVELLLMEFSA